MNTQTFKKKTGIFLKTHWAGIALSVCIGMLVAVPPIFFRFSPHYQGVDMLKHNTESHYVAQVQEVYDGYGSLGNPYAADLKEEPYLFPPLGPHIVAAFGRAFGLSAIEAVMAARFIFVTGLSFLIYAFGVSISGRRWVGVAAAPVILLGSAFLDPRHILRLFSPGAWLGENSFIDYGRPINPQISSLFFFGYLLALWQYLKTGRTRFGVAGAVILGASFYLYLYTWTFALALNGVFAVLSAIHRDWRRVQQVGLVSLGACFIGIPYIIHVLQVRSHPWYAESAPRFGFVSMHAWNISRTVLAAFLVYLASRSLFSENQKRFWLAFFITAIFIVNEQVITGLYLFNHHYHWYYNVPLVLLFLISVFAILCERWHASRFGTIALAGLTALAVYNGIVIQTTSYRSVLPQVIDEQRYAPALSWVNTGVPKATPMFTSHHFSEFLSALTHADSTYTGSLVYTLAPNERLLHAYLSYRYLEGIPTSTIRTYLEEHREDVSDFAFAYQYRFVPGVCSGCFPDSVLDDLANQYQQLTDASFISFLQRHPAEYLVWDTKENPEWRIEERFGLEPHNIFGDIRVYAL